MKPLLAVTATLTLALATAWPQGEPLRIYTRPSIPSREALHRLDMTLGWARRVKTDGPRDGLYSVQLMPGREGMRLLVQTFRGDVALLDAETGDTLWRTPVGKPYEVAKPAAFNSQAIFTTRHEQLYVLDRETGKQLLYDVEKDSSLPLMGLKLEGVPSAGLAADEESVYVCLENRVSGYFVPDFRKLNRLRAREDPEGSKLKLKPSPQLRRDWTNVLAPLQFTQTPLVTRDLLAVIATDGTFVVMNNLEGKDYGRYQVEKPVVAAPAQHRSKAYVASTDYQLYAFDMRGGKLLWRFSGGAPIRNAVQATERDVFLSPERVGLFRIDRTSGTQRWLNKDAERFLANNRKFVYAADRFGNLLVLDYDRGTTLAKYDTRDFTVPVPNELTDRLYLAAHDGLIVCLHHREHRRPLTVKQLPFEGEKQPPPKKDGAKDEMKKDDDKKKDEDMKKDDDKKKEDMKKDDDKKKDDELKKDDKKKDDDKGAALSPRREPWGAPWPRVEAAPALGRPLLLPRRRLEAAWLRERS